MKIFLAIIIAMALVFGISYTTAYNYGNTMDNLLDAVVENNKNIYSITGKKVQEVAQVPGMLRDDQKEIITAAIQGRYGKDGSKAVFQMLQEQNPQLDASLYKKVQEVIESSNNEFQLGQKQLIDVKRQYKTKIGSLWNGLFLRIAGFPKIDLNDHKYQTITTEDANAVYKSGITAPIKLR